MNPLFPEIPKPEIPLKELCRDIESKIKIDISKLDSPIYKDFETSKENNVEGGEKNEISKMETEEDGETLRKKIEQQDKAITRVESGEDQLDTTQKKGNFGEMKTDQDLRNKGYERLSEDMITSLEDPGHQGIDGVYENPEGHPPYLIVDSKFGSSQLSDTSDGKQMSADWIDKRLDDAVGKDKADEIRKEMAINPENVGTYVAHVDDTGNVIYDKVDSNGNTIERNAKINA